MSEFFVAYADAADTIRDRIEEMSKDLPGAFPGRMDTTVTNVAPIIRAIGSIAMYPDVGLTEQGNFLKVSDKVDEAECYTTAALNQQSVIAGEWESDLVRRENATCGFDRGSPDAERILNKFAARDAAAQLQDLAQWLKDPTQGYKIGIVAKADPYVTNLSPEMAERFKRDFVKIHAPALAHEREAKGKIWEAARAVAGLTSRVKASTANPALLADIRSKKAKHSAAERDFLAALTGNVQ